MMSEDSYYYSSDSYSEKISSPIFSKKQLHGPPKLPIKKTTGKINSIQIIKKRSISNIIKTKNTGKLPSKQVPISKILNFPAIKKKVLIPFDSESSSYYDYESESDSEDFPIPCTKSQLKLLNKKALKPINENSANNPNTKHQNINITKSSPPVQQIKQPIIINYEDNEFSKDDPLVDNSFSSSDFIDCFEYKPEYVDTNEEPEFKISDETIKLKKLVQSCPQSHNENIDSTNISNSKVSNKEKLSFTIVCSKSQFSNFVFQFFHNDRCLMSAFSSNIRKSITFSVPSLIDKEDIVFGIMYVSNNKHQFKLECNEKEVMSVEVSTLKTPFLYDCNFTVGLINPDTNNKDIILKTMLPKKESGHKHSKNSTKKVVLVNNDDQQIIEIKRIGEDQLKIIANSLINDDLKIFAIGVASWTFLK